MFLLYAISETIYVYPTENQILSLYVSAVFSSYKPLKLGIPSYTAVFLCGVYFCIVCVFATEHSIL